MAVRATQKALGNLHRKLAKMLSKALDGDSYKDEETGETVVIPANNPALFTAAARFLKDNDIVGIPESEDAVADLQRQLAKRKGSPLPKPSAEDINWPVESRPH